MLVDTVPKDMLIMPPSSSGQLPTSPAATCTSGLLMLPLAEGPAPPLGLWAGLSL